MDKSKMNPGASQKQAEMAGKKTAGAGLLFRVAVAPGAVEGIAGRGIAGVGVAPDVFTALATFALRLSGRPSRYGRAGFGMLALGLR